MKESEVQKLVTKWLRSWRGDCLALEVKTADVGQKIAHSDILSREHQLRALLQIKFGDGVVHKIADVGAGYKQFDCFYMGGKTALAYYLFVFGVKGYLIPPEDVLGTVLDVVGDVRVDGLDGIVVGGRKRGSFSEEWCMGEGYEKVEL